MESGDKSSSDALIEQRLARLEQVVGNYKIVVAGCDGIIRGGFGELRVGQTIQERIANLQTAVAEFHLQPSNLNLNRNGLQPIAVDLLDDDITAAAVGT